MLNKKALSNIVTVLLFIVLALAAVGAIWAVVNNIVKSGTEEISLNSKCLEVDAELVKSVCTEPGVCNVTITRNAGGDEIAGIKLIFTNDLGETNYVHDVSGDIAFLETKTEFDIVTGIVSVSNIEITPYFKDEIGNEQLCSL